MSDTCERCDGDGLAHGSDRPFEWHGPGTYPGPCPACKGTGMRLPGGAVKVPESSDNTKDVR